MSDVISDQPTLKHKLIAEAAGTGLLVLGGCASVVFPRAEGHNPEMVVIAFAFGLSLLMAIVTFGRISGGHFNPAVSSALAAAGRMSWREAGSYSLAQVGGAIVGALTLWITAQGFPDYTHSLGLGQNAFGSGGVHWWSAFIIEYVFTAVFVVVILSVTDRRYALDFAPKAIAIAFALVAIHLATVATTGTSVNPARSIGPALFSGGHAIGQLWLFILAPLGGAIAGAGAYVALFGRDTDPVEGSGIPTLDELRALRPTPSKDAPAWQTPKEPASDGEPPVYEQDGWRWDYAAQQWVPAGDGAEANPTEPTSEIPRES
ncbi:hypothetical protein Back2_09180 [Nocardioides baekrokdamisoli]|uniref:Aquaporin n=1 Tax=Nocardioides baekrokdamisoli TaxID=1804624 RepID=A0A3G9ISL3_9ACTN|nr:aquaporin [Nocardioides baekrokdamisoli]BBH16631.1 hypothetical protein Back2_09180 [Nocardioides baekrokdamisoli]